MLEEILLFICGKQPDLRRVSPLLSLSKIRRWLASCTKQTQSGCSDSGKEGSLSRGIFALVPCYGKAEVGTGKLKQMKNERCARVDMA